MGSTKNQFKDTLTIDNKDYTFFSIQKAKTFSSQFHQLPFCLKILLENQLRFLDNKTVFEDDIKALGNWLETKTSSHEIAYRPARVLMQDFTGVPAIVDLAAMRAAIQKLGGNPELINPLTPVDLVIDHSVQVDKFGNPKAYLENTEIEIERNKERYEFLKWGQQAFENFRVVPPGTGICHQVNLEFLAKVVWSKEDNDTTVLYPDTLVGTDSHTTMINALGVLGWGVGGIEAEAAMLGQPISMIIPEVVGFKLKGKIQEGITATDLVLTVTQQLRQHGVVGKFVEFFGDGLNELGLPDRATISNMAPEYGATCGFFPVDNITLDYLRLTGRDESLIKVVEAYSKAQGLWRDPNEQASYTEVLELDLSSVRPSVAGPKRPQDKVLISDLPKAFRQYEQSENIQVSEKGVSVQNEDYTLNHGDIVIAAITSCTNTSNPSVLMAAGLVAKKAVEFGLSSKPWVKTSLAPGSKVVTNYLEKAGLQEYLNTLGFNLVGYGCTTCIGNSGPLHESIASAITDNDLAVASILSGNRNFEGRVHPHVKTNWLASPPLVVMYALAGTVKINFENTALGKDKNGKDVFFKDLWPTNKEIAFEVSKVDGAMFKKEYSDVFKGDDAWRNIKIDDSKTYEWKEDSTYVQHPPFFDKLSKEITLPTNINNANILALLGDSITTDHISPAGGIKKESPAGEYLLSHNVEQRQFNSYGARRGNHEVMMRGTFANIRIRNKMVPGTEGGLTKYIPTDETMPIYDAAMRYIDDNTDLVVIAGKEYGTGSSRDWAAKGTRLLGVKAVITESYERIHRSNLIGMGVLPLQFTGDDNLKSLGLKGTEIIKIDGIDKVTPGGNIRVSITGDNGDTKSIETLCRIDTQNELNYYQNGGILHYVLRKMAS